MSHQLLLQHRGKSRAGVAEWYTAPCLWHGRLWVRAPVRTEPPSMFLDTSVSMWIKKAQLPCWPLYSQQVLLQRWIWGSHKQESTQGIHPGFETQGRRHQKSKTGVSMAPTKRTYDLIGLRVSFPLDSSCHCVVGKH